MLLAGAVLLVTVGCRDLVVPNEVVEGPSAETIRGQVLGPDGEPLSLARLTVDNRGHLPYPRPSWAIVVWEGYTDPWGRFETGELSRGLPFDIIIHPSDGPLFTLRADGVESAGPMGAVISYPGYNANLGWDLSLDGAPFLPVFLNLRLEFPWAGRMQSYGRSVGSGETGALMVSAVDDVRYELNFGGDGWNVTATDLVPRRARPDSLWGIDVPLVVRPLPLTLGGLPYPDQDMRFDIRSEAPGRLYRATGSEEVLASSVGVRYVEGSKGWVDIDPAWNAPHLGWDYWFDLGQGELPEAIEFGEHRVQLEILDSAGQPVEEDWVGVLSFGGRGLGEAWYDRAGEGAIFLPAGHYILEVYNDDEWGQVAVEVEGDLSRTIQLGPG